MPIWSRVVASWAALVVVLVAGVLSASEGAVYPDPTRWTEEMRLFAQRDAASPAPEGAIVFVGSSSIRLWHEALPEDMAPLTVVPRGFGGSTMEDVRYHIDRLVLRHRPRAIVLYEGDNDVAEGVAPPRILSAFQAIVARLHDALPEARVYVLSVKPSPSRWALWPRMRETNRLLSETCGRDERLIFVDVASPLLGPDGRPRESLYVEDRLHLNAAGYAAWRAVLYPLLLEHEGGHE